MNDRELKEFLERIEVAIPVQQRVLFAEAKRRDEAIDRLADRMTAASKRSGVSRGLAGQVDAAGCEDVQSEQLALDVRCGGVIADTLEYVHRSPVAPGEILRDPAEPHRVD